MPATDLERAVGVSYKTAARMSRLIRADLDDPHSDLRPIGQMPVTYRHTGTAPSSARLPHSPAASDRELWAPGCISTFAGDGTPGYGGDGTHATRAQLNRPHDVAIDQVGNVFIADTGNHVIRMVDAAGRIRTMAGDGMPGYAGDGHPATAAQLNSPTGVAVDGSGNVLIADNGNHVVRKVDMTGTISTIAGTGQPGFSSDGELATEAAFTFPSQVLVVGELVVISDGTNRVRKIDASGFITTIAGNGDPTTSGDGGPATAAGAPSPVGLAIDDLGNLFVAQGGDLGTPDARVRRIDASGTITTVAGGSVAGFAGDGAAATTARLRRPVAVAVDAMGALLISDFYNRRIRRVDQRGTIRTVVGAGHSAFGGNGGPAVAAHVHPIGLAVAAEGDLLIADKWNHRIRLVVGPLPDPPDWIQGMPATAV